LRSHWVLKAACGLALGCLCATVVRAGELRAGAGKVSITPTADEFPYSVPNERDFVGVHDDVYVRALVLEDSAARDRLAIVTIEVTAVPEADRLLKEIAEAAGARTSHVIVAASHTHSVPLVFFHGGEPNRIQQLEMEHIRTGAVQAVRDAVSHLQPARIAFGRGEAWVNVNNGELAGLKTGFDPKGPSDKTLDVIRIQTAGGQPLAMLVNYASHAEVMFRSVTKGNGYEVTGDLPGAVSRMLEGNQAGAPVVLYSAGAEGDQLTVFKSLQPPGALPARDEGAAGWGFLDALANRLTSAVVDTVHGMDAGTSGVAFQAAGGSVTCPGQRLRLDDQTGKASVQDAPPVTIPLSFVRINDIAIAGVGGDVASEIGRRIRTGLAAPNTITMTMLAGAVGYIFPDANYERPGHGLAGSPLKAGCAERSILDGLSGLAKAGKN
jgi:hypothetical protein